MHFGGESVHTVRCPVEGHGWRITRPSDPHSERGTAFLRYRGNPGVPATVHTVARLTGIQEKSTYGSNFILIRRGGLPPVRFQTDSSWSAAARPRRDSFLGGFRASEMGMMNRCWCN
jgi:hypothetical protein